MGREDGPRFALVALPPPQPGGRVYIMAVSEDAVPIAAKRHWIVLARDSDVLPAFNPPTLEL
jgi:hypothetical protein